MTISQDWTFQAKNGGVRYVSEYPNAIEKSWVGLLVHGYGEHIGRYRPLAEALLAAGATVYGPDHEGHGRSEGARALVEDLESVSDDLHEVAVHAAQKNPGLPLVLIGHSLGGLIAARFAQRFGRELAALVLSAPAFGSRAGVEMLLSMDPIPPIPIDPAQLSRDPNVGEAYARDPLVWHGPFKKQTLAAMKQLMDTTENGPAFDNLPTLWIHGEDDNIVSLPDTRKAVERLKGSQFEYKGYPGGRHENFNEINRDEVFSDVIGFIQRTLSKRGVVLKK